MRSCAHALKTTQLFKLNGDKKVAHRFSASRLSFAGGILSNDYMKIKKQRSREAKKQRSKEARNREFVERFKGIFSLPPCILVSLLPILFLLACEGSQFSAYRIEKFETTPVTMSTQKAVYISNPDSGKEQHIRAIGFDKGSNSAGHFMIDGVKVGTESVATKDIVVPPGSSLTIMVTYSPLNLETTFADYGGWETGRPVTWIPHKPGEESNDKEDRAIHRSILQLSYDYPVGGIVQVELVGFAVPGPNGEVNAGGMPGECTPGDGVACYTGGFSIDIPQLYSGGPRDLELGGAIKFTISGGEITMRMDDFPPALMILKSTEIPELPSGVTGTLIVSGGQGKTAAGTFDGNRITLNDVVFRIRFALGEATAGDVTPGMASMIDFEVPNLEITTTEPLVQGMITMHLETTLSDAPSGNELFDQFLSNAKVIVVMKGQLSF